MNKGAISILEGKTLTEIKRNSDPDQYVDELFFLTSDGETFKMYHEQDCYEQVTIEEIIGDLNDLIGNPILLAEERSKTNENARGDIEVETLLKNLDEPERVTWTFYELATIKGSVTIRWLGESNGYYSEEVDFVQIGEGGREIPIIIQVNCMFSAGDKNASEVLKKMKEDIYDAEFHYDEDLALHESKLKVILKGEPRKTRYILDIYERHLSEIPDSLS